MSEWSTTADIGTTFSEMDTLRIYLRDYPLSRTVPMNDFLDHRSAFAAVTYHRTSWLTERQLDSPQVSSVRRKRPRRALDAPCCQSCEAGSCSNAKPFGPRTRHHLLMVLLSDARRTGSVREYKMTAARMPGISGRFARWSDGVVQDRILGIRRRIRIGGHQTLQALASCRIDGLVQTEVYRLRSLFEPIPNFIVSSFQV